MWGKIKKFLWKAAIALVLVIAGVSTMLYFTREKRPAEPKAPATTEARVSPWEVLKSRVDGNEFFRCQSYDDCRGYVVRGQTSDTKVTGVLGSDGSLTITVENKGEKDSPVIVVYADTNGDGILDKVSGSNFPGAASVSKMPEGIRKEAVRKYESFVSYLVDTSDKTLENALYGKPNK